MEYVSLHCEGPDSAVCGRLLNDIVHLQQHVVNHALRDIRRQDGSLRVRRHSIEGFEHSATLCKMSDAQILGMFLTLASPSLRHYRAYSPGTRSRSRL